ncbi:MAG: reverse transcriptase N-terminal domain-containing protein [Rhizonema sp. PD38]|nr:reverse transcriptase N-terminal domain-containing protein [Rhizonema sp. PD38]
MKDRVSNDIGTKEILLSWSDIDWKTVNKRVKNHQTKNLSCDTVGAMESGQKQSGSCKCVATPITRLSVRRVTQDNQGKRTAGYDGQKVKTPLEQVKLVKEWKEYQPWRVQPTKRIYIPKSNGKLRPLGIPALK